MIVRLNLGAFFPVWILLLLFSVLATQGAKTQSPLVSAATPVLAVLGLAAGLRAFFRGFPLLQRKRRIQNTPTSTIRGAAIGPVEVSGRVVGPYTLMAPLSEEECYYYRAVAVGKEDGGERGDESKTVEETLCVPFFVDDGTGRLMVDPRGAEIDIPADLDEECSAESLPETWRGFLERRGLAPETCTRLREHCIKPGETLYVLGTLGEGQAPDLMEDRPPGSPAGILSSEAAALQRLAVWEAMRVPLPENQGGESTREFDAHPRVFLRRSARQPFLISRRSERELVANLAVASNLDIWGGPLMALISLGVLLYWFGWL
ncbi:MAG TPA: GIDE domain-containing protein [Terriglobales bacterium]|jgi:hypothetical protein